MHTVSTAVPRTSDGLADLFSVLTGRGRRSSTRTGLKTGPAGPARGRARWLTRSKPPFVERRATRSLPRPSVEGVTSGLAALVPAISVVMGMRVQAHWSEDLAVVRSLGLTQVGGEGVLSSALQSGLALIPFGSLLLRLALLNPLLVGFGAWLIFRMARSLFPVSASPHLTDLLALGAAWSVALSPAWQQGASTLGSPVLAACLVLLGVCLLQEPRGRSPMALPVVAGLLVCEARSSSLVLLAAWLIVMLQRHQLPTLGRLVQSVVVLAVVIAVCLMPSLVEPLTGYNAWQLGLDLGLPAAGFGPRPLLEDINWYPLVTAAIACFWLALSPRGRRHIVPLATTAALALLFDNSANRLVVVAACGILSARGLLALLTWLAKANLPFTRLGLRIVGLLHLSAILLVAEGGRLRVSHQSVSATREWSDQAFESLPANAMVFAHTPQAAWRLWASRLASGTRPDVVVVPSALLSHGVLAANLLELEPKLHRVIRDVAADGVVSEYAMADLADARPLRVEYDPTWSKRMLQHMVGDGLWFRFAPHPMGRSDRAEATNGSVSAILRIYDAANQQYGRDLATLERLRGDALQHALLLATLGEVRAARRLMRDLREVSVGDRRWKELERTLRRGGPINGEKLLVNARETKSR
jgi:hypothetical protein